jgi:hypothetical protein
VARNSRHEHSLAGGFLQQIRQGVRNLNPREVRDSAERRLAIGVQAPNLFPLIEDYLAPANVSRGKRWELVEFLHRVGDPGAPREFDLVISEEGEDCPPDAFVFSPARPDDLVRRILERREDLGLALARAFPPFRKPVVDKVVLSISSENAMFALVTALPDVIPSAAEIPWAVGQFASDTTFLTMNQIRMAFLLAAASDRPIGYREQKAEIASIITAAFGWRTLARELVGKIPFGGGLIPKAAIAFAGTWVAGASLERIYRSGYGYSRAERRLAYGQAYERGKLVAGAMLKVLKPGKAG